MSEKNENVLNKGMLTETLMSRLEKDFPSKAAADRIVRETFKIITEAVASGTTVRIQDFGTFETYESAERVGRNPQTHEKMTIPGGARVRFRAAPAFKAAARQ